MTARLLPAFDPGTVRASARIERVMELLDLDERTVRRMIDGGELEAHGIGKRGVRIYLDSVRGYQEAKAIAPKRPRRQIEAKRREVSRAKASQSEAALRRSGILP